MSDFSEALKTWRKARRFSQLELAMEADVSARHISFLETGRSRPSREMVDRIGEALRLPLATRNQLYGQAGFAPQYKNSEWTSDEIRPIRDAICQLLANHDPFPGFAVDRLWSVVDMNSSAKNLFSVFGLGIGGSLLDLITSNKLVGFIENWPEVAAHSAQRLRIESAEAGGIKELDAAAELLSHAGGKEQRNSMPVIPTIYRFGDMRLSLFATIAQFGTPQDISLDDLKIELFFPADEETRETLEKLPKVPR